MTISRRGFVGAVAAAPFLRGATSVPFKLGVASYSLRQFPRAKMIENVVALQTPYVAIKEMHLRYVSTAEEIAAARKELADAKLQVTGAGVIDLKGDEAQVRRMFEYAKAAGFPMIVGAPSLANISLIEKMIKEYNIKVAIHNHGPDQPILQTPADVMAAIKDTDPRFGLCIDVGHTVRMGVNIVEAIRATGSRLLDMHMKDLKELRNGAAYCAVGEGAMPVKDIFVELIKMKYTGGVMLEHEIEASNPMPGMIKGFEFMRKVIAEL